MLSFWALAILDQHDLIMCNWLLGIQELEIVLIRDDRMVLAWVTCNADVNKHASSPEPDVVTTLCRVLHQLHWLPVWRRVEFKLACLVRQVLCGQMPTYLADDIRLVFEGNRRSLRSSFDNVCGTTYAQRLRRQKLWRCRSVNLEQSPSWPPNTWHQLQTV